MDPLQPYPTISCNFSIPKSEKCIMSLQFSQDNSLLASAGDDCTVHVFDVYTKSVKHCFNESTAKILSVAFSYDNQFLATAGEDRIIRLYDLNEKILKTSFTDNGGEIYQLTINPIGLLASAGFDGKVRIVDIYTEKQKHIFYEKMVIYACKFSPNGNYLATGGQEKILRVYDMQKLSLKFQLKHHKESIYCVNFSNDNQLIVSGGSDKTCYLISMPQQLILRQFDNYNNQIMSVCFSQEGLLAIGGFENQVLVLDKEMKVKYQTEDHGAMSVCLDFSQDGQLLAVAGEDSVIRVYNMWKVNYVVGN